MAAADRASATPVIIVGGGIGGLTTALALVRQGWRVEVFEKARAIGDVGAGVSLGPPASKGLYSLGLERALRAAADTPSTILAVHYRTGQPVGGVFADRDVSDEERRYLNQIHRADLYAVLKAALADEPGFHLHLDHTFVDLHQDDQGVTAGFANGRKVRGAALIGCDGIRSTVRERLFGVDTLRFTGRVAYRFLVPMADAAPYVTQGGSISYIAPRSSLLRYAVRQGSLVNCVGLTLSGWANEGWSTRVARDELMALFEGWHPDVVALAGLAPLAGTAKWGLFDRDPLSNWTVGRVTLLGDAAHPMMPFLGVGAGMAIEDAVVLGRAFAETSEVAHALCVYQAARLVRANRMLLESRVRAETFAEGPQSKRAPTMTRAEMLDYDPSVAGL